MAETIVVRGPNGPRRQKARADSFTKRKQQRFLDALAATCNIRAAAAHAGVSVQTVYNRREWDEAFAQAWGRAIVMAYDRIEGLLLAQGGGAEGLDAADAERAEAEGAARPDFDKMYKILMLYAKKREGTRTPRIARGATREETNAALLKSLATAKRRMERVHGR